MKSKLEGMKGSPSAATKGYLSVDFNKDVQGIETLIKKQDLLFRNTKQQTSLMGRMWGQMGNQIKSVLSIYALQRFTRQLIEMGGEFEKQHYALRAIIGDMGKADQIFNNLKKVAVKSPFHFGDFTNYAKQLAAFSIPINEIYDTTKRLADVSSGLGVDMSRIILAYGQIRSASFLRGQEVRQLTEAGIPIIEELSKKLTELRGQVVSTSEVFDSISRREVPFEMVKDIFKELTDEGGKFYNMQEILAESLSGKWANLTSHYQIMLYDMAQSNRGFLHGLIEVLTKMVVNFKAVESAIWGMVAAYAAHRGLSYIATIKKEVKAWSLVAPEIRKNAKELLSFTNIGTAAAMAITTAIVYIKKKSDEYNEEINSIISATFELTEKFSGQMNALIDLAKVTDDNSNVLVEREKILNKIAETEPDVAREIRNHADDVEYLTDKLNKYVVAKQAARDVELGLKGDSWLADSVEDVEEDLTKARGSLALINIEFRREFAKLEKDISNVGLEKALKKYYGTVGVAAIDGVSKILEDTSLKAEEKLIEVAKAVQKKAVELSSYGAQQDVARSQMARYAKALRVVASAEKDFNEKVAEAAEVLDLSIAFKLKNDNIKKGTQEYKDIIYDAITSIEGLSDEFIDALFKEKGLDPAQYKKDLNLLDGWRKEISDIVGSVVQIAKEDSVEKVMGNISTEISNIKKALESVDITKLRAIVSGGGGTDAQKEVILNYDAQTKALESLTKAKERLGIVEKEKGGDSSKDIFADKMSKQIKLIEDAKTAYEKYIPLLGKAEALSKIRGDDRYSSLDFDPSSFEASLRDIYAKLGNTDAQKKLKEQLEKTFSDIDFNNVKDGVDRFTKDLSNYIDSNKERWNLFDKLFEQTGNQKLSFTLAFGTEEESQLTSYLDSLEAKLKELTEVDGISLDNLLAMDTSSLEDNYGKPIIDLITKIKEARRKASEEILLSDAKAIAEVATIEEKANKVRGDYQAKIEETSNEEAKAAYLELMNKELSDLYVKAIELTPIWMKLFGDVSDYSYNMLKGLVKEAEELVSTATEIKDKDGRSTGMFKLQGGNGEEYELTAEAYTRMLKNIGKKAEEIRSRNPFEAFAKSWKDFINADNGEAKQKALTGLLKSTAGMADMLGDIASGFSDMFASLGNDDLADTLDLLGDVTEAVSSISEGFTQGGIVGGAVATLGAVPKLIGSIADKHDKKLDRKIQKSANEVKRLSNAYENLNREIERQLGVMTRGQVDKQIASLKGQVSQTYQMMEKERKKKKSDVGKIEDYKQQIKELQDQLLYYYEDLAGQLYDVNLKDWSNQLSSSIMDAWRKGGDAALAYEKTANDVLANVANKMVAEAVFEPVFKQLREKLPEMLDKGSFTKEDMGLLAEILVNAGGQYEEATSKLDELNEVIKELSGGKLDLKLGDDLESNLGQGIQSLTEDTAQLLASYLNAIRQDVSVKRDLLLRIAEAFDGSVVGNIAAMAADIKKIEANTFRSANGVDAINEKMDNIMNGTRVIYTN